MITLYKIGIFLHVSGALLLSFLLGLEWVLITNLRKSENHQQALSWVMLMKVIARVSPFTWILILIPGFYMISQSWGWTAWVLTSIAGWLIIFISGAILTARRMSTMAKEIMDDQQFTPALQQKASGNFLSTSLRLRTMVTLGIIFLMTVKPSFYQSVAVLCISVIAGFLPVGLQAKVKQG